MIYNNGRSESVVGYETYNNGCSTKRCRKLGIQQRLYLKVLWKVGHTTTVDYARCRKNFQQRFLDP